MLVKINWCKCNIFNFEDIYGYWLCDNVIYDIFNIVISQDVVGCVVIFGLVKDWVDIIVGGMIFVISLMCFLDFDWMIFF